MKKTLLTSIAALCLATGTVRADPAIPDGIFSLEIPPDFVQSSPPPGYPNICVCKEPRFFFLTYCVADIEKISETCLVTNSQAIKPAIVEISRSGDPPYIVIRQGQARSAPPIHFAESSYQRTEMKKLFLTGIAALLLTTGTTHAYPPRYYDCGKAFVKIQTGKGTAPSGNRVFPTTWTIAEN
jgi:hypothetical protein